MTSFRPLNPYPPPQGPPPQYTTSRYAPPPQPYYPTYHAPQYPPRPVQSHFQPQTQTYAPRTGFTSLPPRFHAWNASHGLSSYLEMGAHPGSRPAYSAKVTGGTKTKFKPGPYSDDAPSVGEARSKHLFSSKSIISFQGYESTLDGTRSSGRCPLNLPVRGRSEPWEWRKVRRQDASIVSRLLKSGGMGDWELCPAGSPKGTPPMATWTDAGGSCFSSGKDMGVFEFHGPARAGVLGDGFMAVAVISLMRLLHLYVVEQIASAAGGG